MKPIFLIFLCMLLMIPVFSTTEEYPLASDYAVLMDAATGQTLYQKHMQDLAYPASTTKIMTALLVCEAGVLDDMLTVSESAVDIEEWNSTNIGLLPGETLRVDDVMYALMLHSANDAANALAEHVAGSQERFVERMNQRAWQMGLTRTRFANAHGLHHPRHYTTAEDLAILTRYAIQNDHFMRYFGASEHTIPPTNLSPFPRTVSNHQQMLMEASTYYDPTVIGGKVGFTNPAQHTMSTVAVIDGRTVVCVVMHSIEQTQKFQDTALLLDRAESILPGLPTVDMETKAARSNANPQTDDTEDSLISRILHLLFSSLGLSIVFLLLFLFRSRKCKRQ